MGDISLKVFSSPKISREFSFITGNFYNCSLQNVAHYTQIVLPLRTQKFRKFNCEKPMCRQTNLEFGLRAKIFNEVPSGLAQLLKYVLRVVFLRGLPTRKSNSKVNVTNVAEVLNKCKIDVARRHNLLFQQNNFCILTVLPFIWTPRNDQIGKSGDSVYGICEHKVLSITAISE